MLHRHKDTVKDKRNYEAVKKSTVISQFISKSATQSDEVANDELLIAGYFAEHHKTFVYADHIVTLCKRIFS